MRMALVKSPSNTEMNGATQKDGVLSPYRNTNGSTELNSSEYVELQFGRFQNTHSVLDNVLRGIFDWPDIVFVPKGVIKDQIQASLRT
jgi:hypothetical protein